ncbi:hypothetical protein DAEQUDRAFT_730875 [Daedalea quercina L-15889]|uniref:Uncharacterized protein n=1 Tax=Daedalea quercina L-15889 TaxID=1314783 RepID=A0A165MPI6_9APHY|nr:hypothetical protein DAEQUDRAFT_730875 [Daedalea quercina L-15889]
MTVDGLPSLYEWKVRGLCSRRRSLWECSLICMIACTHAPDVPSRPRDCYSSSPVGPGLHRGSGYTSETVVSRCSNILTVRPQRWTDSLGPVRHDNTPVVEAVQGCPLETGSGCRLLLGSPPCSWSLPTSSPLKSPVKVASDHMHTVGWKLLIFLKQFRAISAQ